jgi:hypothetical protein
MGTKAKRKAARFSTLKAAPQPPLSGPWIEGASTEHSGGPPKRLPSRRHALGLLTLKRHGSTMTMLSARGVTAEMIDELIAAGFATASIERVGLGSIESTRVKITKAGRRVL